MWQETARPAFAFLTYRRLAEIDGSESMQDEPDSDSWGEKNVFDAQGRNEPGWPLPSTRFVACFIGFRLNWRDDSFHRGHEQV